MATIILNNKEFDFGDYGRTTYFYGERIESNGYVNSIRGTNAASDLNTLAEDTITLIRIIKDNETIYELDNIAAHITSISEGYNGENLYINVNLTFSNT